MFDPKFVDGFRDFDMLVLFIFSQKPWGGTIIILQLTLQFL